MSIDLTKALARSTDPVQSHRAAAAVNVRGVRAGVLFILRDKGTFMNGTDVNTEYALGLPRPAWWSECKTDTPRKRLSDLRSKGLIMPRYSLKVTEQEYVITVDGMDALDAWEQKRQATK